MGEGGKEELACECHGTRVIYLKKNTIVQGMERDVELLSLLGPTGKPEAQNLNERGA